MKRQRIAWLPAIALLALLATGRLEAVSGDSCSSPSSCVFYGLQHRALGTATLSIDGSGRLVVTNIGSSGNDGVQIALGAANSWKAKLADALDAATLPTGAYIRKTLRGQINGIDDQTILIGRWEDIGSQLELTIDYTPIGATTHTIIIRNGATQVAMVAGHTGPAIRLAAIPAGSAPCYIRVDYGHWLCCESFAGPVSITIPGGPTVVGDYFEIQPDGATSGGLFMSGLSMQGSGVSPLTITSETVAPQVNIIPTLSEWGMMALALFLLITGTIFVFKRSRYAFRA